MWRKSPHQRRSRCQTAAGFCPPNRPLRNFAAPSTPLTAPPGAESPAFHSPRVRSAARGRKDLSPRFDCATRLRAEIGSDLLFASSETRRVVDPPVVVTTGSKHPLSFGGMYEQPRTARRIAGPAFARREVSWPRSAETRVSPAARPAATSARASSWPTAPRTSKFANAGPHNPARRERSWASQISDAGLASLLDPHPLCPASAHAPATEFAGSELIVSLRGRTDGVGRDANEPADGRDPARLLHCHSSHARSAGS